MAAYTSHLAEDSEYGRMLRLIKQNVHEVEADAEVWLGSFVQTQTDIQGGRGFYGPYVRFDG